MGTARSSPRSALRKQGDTYPTGTAKKGGSHQPDVFLPQTCWRSHLPAHHPLWLVGFPWGLPLSGVFVSLQGDPAREHRQRNEAGARLGLPSLRAGPAVW